MGHPNLRDQRGQGLIEYVILVAMIGIATMGLVRVLQTSINAQLANVTNALEGRSGRKAGETVSDDAIRKKDFSDFMNGAASRER